MLEDKRHTQSRKGVTTLKERGGNIMERVSVIYEKNL